MKSYKEVVKLLGEQKSNNYLSDGFTMENVVSIVGFIYDISIDQVNKDVKQESEGSSS